MTACANRALWYVLAETLGRSLAETQAEIDSAEFTRWIAWYSWRSSDDRPPMSDEDMRAEIRRARGS